MRHQYFGFTCFLLLLLCFDFTSVSFWGSCVSQIGSDNFFFFRVTSCSNNSIGCKEQCLGNTLKSSDWVFYQPIWKYRVSPKPSFLMCLCMSLLRNIHRNTYVSNCIRFVISLDNLFIEFGITYTLKVFKACYILSFIVPKKLNIYIFTRKLHYNFIKFLTYG